VSRTSRLPALLRAAGGLLPLLGLGLGTARAGPPPRGAQAVETALARGDSLFRAGDFRGAMGAYAAAAPGGRADPLLAYDLGATAHRLGRLPEAVLWYRRAARPLVSDLWPDPWLAENLAAARRSLGTGPPRPRGRARWAARREELRAAGALLAWAALAIYLLPGRRNTRRRAVAALALLAVASFGAGEWLARRGPRAAVLLAPCGPLPAGSEVWVEPAPSSGNRLQVTGGPACPAAAIGLVEPP
jgi:hypothetical protein